MSYLCRLNRAVLRLRATTAASYLQGLITNDVTQLTKNSCLYTAFLNAKGRVFLDSFIYSTEDPDEFLLECDHTLSGNFQKHLKLYGIGRKIDVGPSDQKIWVAFHENDAEIPNERIKLDNARIFDDPRTKYLGKRILAPESAQNSIQTHSVEDYIRFRYNLGVSEGIVNVPSGNSFPLECNFDLLNGVSFQKGCYIGQELTARTFHTGVVRKRLMPILFDRTIDENIPNDTPIYDSNNTAKSIGKIRGVRGNVGIGLLRINEALSASSLVIVGNSAKTFIPKWWPTDLPKYK